MSEPVRRARPRRSVLGCLGAVVVMVLLVVAAAEVALRIADWRAGRDADFFLPHQDMSQAQYEPHPYLGLVQRPGWDKREQPAEEKGKHYQVHINALGLRGPETTREKPPGVYRIVCIGGSTTFGTGATSDDKSYPARLEALLNRLAETGHAAEGIRYEVLNAGVSGYNSIDSLINLELRLVELQPDAVIDYDAGNDGRIIQTRDFQPDYSHARRPPPIIELSALERFLLGHCHIYAHLVRGTDPEKQLGAVANWVFVPGWDQQAVSSLVWINEYGLSVFGRNLRQICAVARAAGAQPVLQTFASRLADDPTYPELGVFLARANQVIHDLGAELHVPVVPTAEMLTGKSDLYDDAMHFNDAGELAHARAIADFALKQGLFGLH
jgi:lysophospholipase L1-like esterase